MSHGVDVASDLDEFVALFVDEEFALVTLEPLTPQAPNPVVAVGAKRFL